MWVARDKCGILCLYRQKPQKNFLTESWDSSDYDFMYLDSKWFPEVAWEDEEPTKVKILIKSDDEKRMTGAQAIIAFTSIILGIVIGVYAASNGKEVLVFLSLILACIGGAYYRDCFPRNRI